MNNQINPFLLTDGYKTGHHKMYPEGTTLVYSNFTPRHGKHSNIKGGEGVVSFGQQMVMRQIKYIFDSGFFMTTDISENTPVSIREKVKERVCQEIKREYSMYLSTNYDVSHIEALWELGYLPIKVKAIEEGTFVPYGVPVLTIVNTKPEFFWLTNFLETLISTMLWMPMTAATTAYSYKKILKKACLETDRGSIDFVDFQGHNFSMRGLAGIDSTIYAGLGHDTSFKGDDSLPSIIGARKFYDEKGFVVGSVNATEHSVMCAGTKGEELETFRYLMKQFPEGVLSIVSDTWDLWRVLTKYLPLLKKEILAREGKIVIRPDSGDPVDIICGGNTRSTHYTKADGEGRSLLYYYSKEGEYCTREEFYSRVKGSLEYVQAKGVIELLWDVFGGSINSQGYKVLDPHIGAIYGDSITLERAELICDRLRVKGFASTNIVLGLGSYSYQMVTRDTHGFAMKATYVEVKSLCEEPDDCLTYPADCTICSKPLSKGREIFKDPVTGDGTKKSAAGLLRVAKNYSTGGLSLVDRVTKSEEEEGELRVIFYNGELEKSTTLTEIRERVNNIVR